MQNQELSSTRYMAESGIMAAISLVLIFIGTYLPILGIVASFVWSVPLMYLVMRYSLGKALPAAAVIAVLCFLLFGPIGGIFKILPVVGFGLAYGFCFKKDWSPFKTIFAGALVAGVVTAATLIAASLLGSISYQSLFDQMEEYFTTLFITYENYGMDITAMTGGYSAEEYIEIITSWLKILIPALLTIYAMMMAVFNYVFAVLILRRLSFDVRSLPPFKEWHFPWQCIWGLIIALIFYFLGIYLKNDVCTMIAANIGYIYLPILTISGISVIAFFLDRTGLTKGVKILVWVMIVLFSRITLILILVGGVFDIILDYRKRMVKKP